MVSLFLGLTLCRSQNDPLGGCVCEIDVGDFLCLEVDASPLLELSIGSEEAVGPTDSVISSNWADSCLSKGGAGRLSLEYTSGMRSAWIFS